MAHSTPEQLAAFFDRYRAFSNHVQAGQFEQLQSGFERISAGLHRVRAEADELNRSVASGFNIFHLLGVADLEVTTHSALLADLLDPHGAHAQQHLFLTGFVQHCAVKFDDFPRITGDIASGRWVVEKEKITPFGHLDLVISCRALGFMLVIENKVWATEQPDQLKRYYEWMQQRRERYSEQGLIYLTPWGSQAYTGGGVPCFQLSYHKDISSWLEAALRSVAAPRVRETIIQYLEVIKTL